MKKQWQNTLPIFILLGLCLGYSSCIPQKIDIDRPAKVTISKTTTNNTNNGSGGGGAEGIVGNLDTTFGNDDDSISTAGIVGNHNASGGNGNDVGYAMALADDRYLFVAGYSKRGASNNDMVLWKYSEDGELDVGFNSTGFVTHNSAAAGNGDDSGNAVAVDSSGNIFVAGESRNASNLDMALWKYTDTGSLDTSFGGGDGILVHDRAAGGIVNASNHDVGKGIALNTSDGTVFVVGRSKNISTNDDMVVWKYNAAGTALIGAFAASSSIPGILILDGSAGGSGDDGAEAVVLGSDGYLYVAGYSTNGSSNADMMLWKINKTTGAEVCSLVANNAAGGNSHDYGRALALDESNGRVYVVGESLNVSVNTDMAVWKIKTSDCTLDTTFGIAGTGVVVHDNAAGATLNPNDYGRGVALDISKSHVYIGGNSMNTGNNYDIALWRYSLNGVLDTTFGTGGIVFANSAAGGGGHDLINAIAGPSEWQRLICVGQSENNAASKNYDMVIWKYE